MVEIREFDKQKPIKLCFVCLGNICRSPTAEGVFQHLVNEKNLASFFEIDSAGTAAYHVGEPANSKSRAIAEKNGVKLLSTAQHFTASDIDYYDLILAMDSNNLMDIKSMAGKSLKTDHVLLFRSFDPEPDSKDVPDPYYGGMRGFEEVFDIVYRTSLNLLNTLEPKLVR